MLTIIRYGGFPMYPILAFGFLALGFAAKHAMRPDARLGRVARELARATRYATFAAVAADLATVCVNANKHWDEWQPQVARVLLQGLAESLCPAIVGLPLVALVALLTAVAARVPEERAGL